MDSTPNGPQTPGADSLDGVRLYDLVSIIAANLRVILLTLILFGVLGLWRAIVAPPEYQSSAIIMRESGSEGGSSAALSALRGFGISLGNRGGSGLDEDSYAEIIRSEEFLVAVARDTFYFPETGMTETYVAYQSRTQEEGLLKTIFNGIRSIPSKLYSLVKPKRPTVDTGAAEGVTEGYSLEEKMAAIAITNLLEESVDPVTRIMTLTAAEGDPLLASQIANSAVENLETRVRELSSQKSRLDLEFVRQRLEEAEVDLRVAEDALADYVDANVGIQAAILRTAMDRLARNVNFRTEVYSELLTQETNLELEVRKKESILTILAKPTVPLRAARPNRLSILLIWIVFGVVAVVVIISVRHQASRVRVDQEASRRFSDFIATVKQQLLGRRRGPE